MPDLTLKRKIYTLYCCTFRPLSYNYPYEGNLSTLWPRAFLRKKSIKKSHEPKQITMVFLGPRHTKLIFAFFLPRYESLRRIKVNIFWEDHINLKWSSCFLTLLSSFKGEWNIFLNYFGLLRIFELYKRVHTY